MIRPRNFSGLLLALCSLTGLSCSEGPAPDREPLFPVTGKVLVQGEPAENALVVLHPADGAASQTTPAPNARVQPDGAFTIGTYETADGAPRGEYLATIIWPAPPAGPMPDPDAAPDRLDGRYANPQTSPFRVRVEESENELDPFLIPPGS